MRSLTNHATASSNGSTEMRRLTTFRSAAGRFVNLGPSDLRSTSHELLMSANSSNSLDDSNTSLEVGMPRGPLAHILDLMENLPCLVMHLAHTDLTICPFDIASQISGESKMAGGLEDEEAGAGGRRSKSNSVGGKAPWIERIDKLDLEMDRVSTGEHYPTIHSNGHEHGSDECVWLRLAAPTWLSACPTLTRVPRVLCRDPWAGLSLLGQSVEKLSDAVLTNQQGPWYQRALRDCVSFLRHHSAGIKPRSPAYSSVHLDEPASPDRRPTEL